MTISDYLLALLNVFLLIVLAIYLVKTAIDLYILHIKFRRSDEIMYILQEINTFAVENFEQSKDLPDEQRTEAKRLTVDILNWILRFDFSSACDDYKTDVETYLDAFKKDFEGRIDFS